MAVPLESRFGVILMVNTHATQRTPNQIMMLVVLMIALLVLGGVIVSVQYPLWESMQAGKPVSMMDNVAALGDVLYTDYFEVFQAAGLLLLAAIVAAIGLVHRKPDPRIKRQTIAAQIQRDSRTVIHTVKDIPKGSI